MTAEATFIGGGQVTDRRMDEFRPPEYTVDFAKQEAKNFVIENRTSDPENPVTGQIWIRTDL